MEPGTGKTKIVVDYAGCLALREGATRVLVVAPLGVLGVWDQEIRKHLSENVSLDWEIVNYDRVWARREEYVLWEPDIVVADESHYIKNHIAQRSKALHMIGRHAKHRVLMTGTPTSSQHLEIFSQFKFLDPTVFGTRWLDFREKYGLWGGYMKKKFLRPMRTKVLRKKIKPYVFRRKKEECLDLPPYTHQIVPVSLDKSVATYDQMADDSVVELQEDEILAEIILTQLLRLSQITGGWIRGEEAYHRVGMEKLRVFQSLLRDLREADRTKIVVFARFKKELRDIAYISKKAGYNFLLMHGGVSESKRDLKYCKFEETGTPTVMVHQIATGQGRNELVVAREAIFYSHDDSWIHFKQACDRLHRIGQRHPVTYYHLIAKHPTRRFTVDQLRWMSLRTKRDLGELVMKRPELLSET